jgi:hypothetical protein
MLNHTECHIVISASKHPPFQSQSSADHRIPTPKGKVPLHLSHTVTTYLHAVVGKVLQGTSIYDAVPKLHVYVHYDLSSPKLLERTVHCVHTRFSLPVTSYALTAEHTNGVS